MAVKKSGDGDQRSEEREVEFEHEEHDGRPRLKSVSKSTPAEKVEAAMEMSDLVERAKLLKASKTIELPEVKPGKYSDTPKFADRNLRVIFDAMFPECVDRRPHYDEWRGMSVDWDGRPINKDVNVIQLGEAVAAFGIPDVKYSVVRNILYDWTKQHRQNDLQIKVKSKLPEWDGVERLEAYLIGLYNGRDTDFNRRIGKYLWLSLFGRVMYPGCQAAIVTTFIGSQHSGKSELPRRISFEMIGQGARPVRLNLAAQDQKDFLRAITGQGVIASIAEMKGLGTGSLESMKDFIVASSDSVDIKYEPAKFMDRQWIIMMDGNKDEGLYRDETGNRRIAAFIVDQKDDEGGKRAWGDEFKADFRDFAAQFWQLMAEAKLWWDSEGISGWNEFHDETVDIVAADAKKLVKQGKGVIRDDEMEDNIIPALSMVEKSLVDGYIKGGVKNTGVFVKSCDIQAVVKMICRSGRINTTHLSVQIGVHGGEKYTHKNVRGFLFRDIETFAEWHKKFGGKEDDAKMSIESMAQAQIDKMRNGSGGGF